MEQRESKKVQIGGGVETDRGATIIRLEEPNTPKGGRRGAAMKKGGKIPRIDEPVIVREKTVPNFTETKCEISDNFGDVKKPKFNCSAVHSEKQKI